MGRQKVEKLILNVQIEYPMTTHQDVYSQDPEKAARLDQRYFRDDSAHRIQQFLKQGYKAKITVTPKE